MAPPEATPPPGTRSDTCWATFAYSSFAAEERDYGGPMRVSKFLQSSMRAIGLLSILPLTACAAISDGSITYDRKPCNVLCQRWMGVENRPQSPFMPLPLQPPVVKKRLVIRPQASVEYQPSRRNRPLPAGSSPPSDRPLFMPATESSNFAQAPATTSPPPNRWGMQLPGSSEALPSVWRSQ